MAGRGTHPIDRPVVVIVVTHVVSEDWIAGHPVAPFTFVTDRLLSAIEPPRSIARDRDIR